MDPIADRVKRTQEKYSKNQPKEKPFPQEYKICPFMSTGGNLMPCNPSCAIYRSGKQKGYECPFTELTSMSWFIKGQPHKGK